MSVTEKMFVDEGMKGSQKTKEMDRKRRFEEKYAGKFSEDDAQYLKRLRILEGESRAESNVSLGFILKSIVKFDGKLSNETDTEALEAAIRKIKMETVLWKSFKYVWDGDGDCKFEISCVLQQDKVSVFELCDVIEGISKNIQSICVSAVDHRTHARLALAQKPADKKAFAAALLNITL